MTWICEDCTTNNEDSALECCVCGSSKASSVERASKRAAEEEKKLREVRDAAERERKARETEERDKKAKEEAERLFWEREEKRRAKEAHKIEKRELAAKEKATLIAAREARARAKMGGFKPGYKPKTSGKAGKVFLVLLLVGLASFGAGMLYRAVNEGSIDVPHGSVTNAFQSSTPVPTEEPHEYGYIAHVDSGALVFKEPSRSSETITKIKKGERVEIVEREPDGEWCVIYYNDIYAYIQLKYLDVE
jgi:hypothetical protein